MRCRTRAAAQSVALTLLALAWLIACDSADESSSSTTSGSGGAGGGATSAAGGAGGCVSAAGTGKTASSCSEIADADANCNPDADPPFPGPATEACRAGFRSLLAAVAEALHACLVAIPDSSDPCNDTAANECVAQMVATACSQSAAQQLCQTILAGCPQAFASEDDCLLELSPVSEGGLAWIDECLTVSMGSDCAMMYRSCSDSYVFWRLP